MPFCTAADLFAFGVPRGATPNPGRTIHVAEDDTFTLDAHDFALNDPVVFRPAGDSAMPSGLSEGVTYYAIPVTPYTFQVAAAASGGAVTFTDAEDPLVVVSPLPVAEAIAWADAMCLDMIPAHVVPEDGAPVPAILRMTAAELAAGKLLALSGASSSSLAATVDNANARLARWAKGVPMRGSDVPGPANLTVSAPAVAAPALPYTDPRGWARFGKF